MRQIKTAVIIFCFFITGVCRAGSPELHEPEILLHPPSEVIIAEEHQVIIRDHPQTRLPYVSIVGAAVATQEQTIKIPSDALGRPDYRMLSYRTAAGVPAYKGPSSDRTKVYVLAGTLIATGIATAAIGAAAPAAVGAASSGAGAYAVAGSTVGVTTLATALLTSRPDPDENDFTHTSHTRMVEFYGFDQ
jgi:hypothetical protein